MLSKKQNLSHKQDHEKYLNPGAKSRANIKRIPRFELPESMMDAEIAYRICHDEMELDHNPLLNLASFVTTQMDEHADRLIKENLNKNYVDHKEYPQLEVIQERCVNIIANLFNAPDNEEALGVVTIGSSEAVMLAGLSMKRRWQQERRQSPLDKPNMVMGAEVQVVWEKFCNYFEVEARYVPVSKDQYIMTPEDMMKHVDHNTIGVMGILGTTYTGQYEPIKEICAALDKYQEDTGIDIPVHVDAASGGFVAPFLSPDLEWDFRLPRVVSINTSGHKYGLVYPGVGWAIWRHKKYIPDDLVFHLNYLGADQITFTLNFSRGGSHILAQYYNFLRLGFEGYKGIMTYLTELSLEFRHGLKKLLGEHVEFLSTPDAVPLVTWRFHNETKYTSFDISGELEKKGWVVPAYTMPANIEDMNVMRVVFREGFNQDLVHALLGDIKEIIEEFEKIPPQKSMPKDKKNAKKVC